MRWDILLLRWIHILSGVFWAGASFSFAGFIEPAVRRSGPEGGRFMQSLAAHTRYWIVMGIAAALATLAGLELFWIDSGRLNPAWLGTGTGLALTTGGAAGIVAAVIGFTFQFFSTGRLQRLGQEIGRSGGAQRPPRRRNCRVFRRSCALEADGSPRSC